MHSANTINLDNDFEKGQEARKELAAIRAKKEEFWSTTIGGLVKTVLSIVGGAALMYLATVIK